MKSCHTCRHWGMLPRHPDAKGPRYGICKAPVPEWVSYAMDHHPEICTHETTDSEDGCGCVMWEARP